MCQTKEIKRVNSDWKHEIESESNEKNSGGKKAIPKFNVKGRRLTASLTRMTKTAD